MRFLLSELLIGRLRHVQAARGHQDEITEAEDAFLLDPGLGAPAYLTYDGRVLLDLESWDGTTNREADDNEAIASLIVGAKKMGVPELLELLPQPPVGARPCERCMGERWVTFGTEVGSDDPGKIVCFTCSGRGWAL